MVKPLTLLLAAALLALAHAQKYATPQEAKAEMCLRGIFQEGGDTGVHRLFDGTSAGLT